MQDVDRNRLLPAEAEFDADYTEALRSIASAVPKWSHLHVRSGRDAAAIGKEMAQLESVPASLTLTFVSRVMLARAATTKEISAGLLWY